MTHITKIPNTYLVKNSTLTPAYNNNKSMPPTNQPRRLIAETHWGGLPEPVEAERYSATSLGALYHHITVHCITVQGHKGTCSRPSSNDKTQLRQQGAHTHACSCGISAPTATQKKYTRVASQQNLFSTSYFPTTHKHPLPSTHHHTLTH